MEPKNIKSDDPFIKQIGIKEKRKLKGKQESKRSVWFGLGMFGLVGWSVAIPTLLGVALGIWLDKKHGQSFSWTITFLIIGLSAGCLIAWHWVAKENREMHQDKEEENG